MKVNNMRITYKGHGLAVAPRVTIGSTVRVNRISPVIALTSTCPARA
jgi:hypothetical protein